MKGESVGLFCIPLLLLGDNSVSFRDNEASLGAFFSMRSVSYEKTLCDYFISELPCVEAG
jgi:hypothetical protein